MIQSHSQWHGMRKLWHISACLFMIMFYFLWRGIVTPIHWLNCILFFNWLLAAICVSIDVIRFYRPLENRAFMRLPFYGTILRGHEQKGYSASTHVLVATAIMVSCVYLGRISEFDLICSIAVLALCDPVAALGRYLFHNFRVDIARTAGFIFFVLSALGILSGVGWFYSLNNQHAFAISTIFAALTETYTGYLWNSFKRLMIITTTPIGLKVPLWISGFYPDDNLTVPLSLAFALSFFGL